MNPVGEIATIRAWYTGGTARGREPNFEYVANKKSEMNKNWQKVIVLAHVRIFFE